MIEIRIDYHNDQVNIDYGAGGQIDIDVDLKYTKVETILNEIFNRIMHSGESVILTKCDEEYKFTIGEW